MIGWWQRLQWTPPARTSGAQRRRSCWWRWRYLGSAMLSPGGVASVLLVDGSVWFAAYAVLVAV